MPLTVLIGVGIIAFALLAYRRRGSSSRRYRKKGRRGPRYKSRFWDK